MTALSATQARALGIRVPPRRKATALPKPMNREEAAFAARLATDPLVKFWIFEGVKLRLADQCFYTPDFVYSEENPAEGIYRVTVVEVKAFWRGRAGAAGRVGWREDSRVKWKCAAEMYPCFRFLAAWREDGEWRFEVYGETSHHGDTETRRRTEEAKR